MFYESAEPLQPAAANLVASQESIDDIDAHLEELLLFARRVSYERATGLISDELEGGFGSLEIETRESITPEQSALQHELSLHLPISNETSESASISLRKTHEGQWALWFSDNLSQGQANPRNLLSKLTSSEETPAGIKTFAQFVTASLKDKQTVEIVEEVALEDDAATTIWQKIQADLDGFDVPTRYDFSIDTTLDDKRAFILASGYPPKSDGTRIPDSEIPFKATHIVVDGDFSFDRTVTMGRDDTTYSKDISADALPELTADERARHNYVVLPVGFGSEQHDEGKQVQLTATGEPTVLPEHPTEGYKVISADVAGALSVSVTVYRPTLEGAQAVADTLYKQDLARAKSSPVLTEERAQHVTSTLQRITGNMRNQALFY